MNRKAQFIRFLIFTILIAFTLFGAISYLYLADDAGNPYNIRVSSITSNSAIVTWETESEIYGEVAFNKTNSWPLLEKYFGEYETAYDDRNMVLSEFKNSAETPSTFEYLFDKNIAKKRKIHFVTLRNLEPETEYFVKFLGDFRATENISFSTFTKSKSIPEDPKPIYGDIDNFEIDQPEPSEGILLFQLYPKEGSLDPSQFYATLINDEAKWSSDLSNIVDDSGNLISWNSETYKIFIDANTNVGSGVGYFSLDDPTPVNDVVVNVRYIPVIQN